MQQLEIAIFFLPVPFVFKIPILLFLQSMFGLSHLPPPRRNCPLSLPSPFSAIDCSNYYCCVGGIFLLLPLSPHRKTRTINTNTKTKNISEKRARHTPTIPVQSMPLPPSLHLSVPPHHHLSFKSTNCAASTVLAKSLFLFPPSFPPSFPPYQHQN